MKIRADALATDRLPAANRGGMGVCLPGGGSDQPLLRVESWTCSGGMHGTLPQSQDQAWPCGSLLPNDLGLFDMLGNVYEWCQDRSLRYRTSGTSIIDDDITNLGYINEKNTRLLRGGAFDYHPASVRSANRYWDAPSFRVVTNGFRPSRTYH